MISHKHACYLAILSGATITLVVYYASNSIPMLTVALVPGIWAAIKMHTPDIHGGPGFLRIALAIDCLLYSLVTLVMVEAWCLIRRRAGQ
jgi:hypothetical protein